MVDQGVNLMIKIHVTCLAVEVKVEEELVRPELHTLIQIKVRQVTEK